MADPDLRDMIANLQAYIDRRAGEIAKPHINAARGAAFDQVVTAKREQQRVEDLITEMRRQFAALERHNERYRERAEVAEAAIVRGLAALATPPSPDPDANEFTIATWRRGYQACAAHVRTALNGNLDQQEAEDSGTHSPPAVLNVHKAALQEIDRVVGNELTLDESETSRLRGILFAALSEEHTRG